jgi:hypothetical protein
VIVWLEEEWEEEEAEEAVAWAAAEAAAMPWAQAETASAPPVATRWLIRLESPATNRNARNVDLR